MKYLPLLELHLLHPYYVDQRCPDFVIEPTVVTQQLVSNQRGVLKYVPDGLRLLLLVDDQNAPFIPLPADLALTFRLKLQNPDFALFTDLTTYHQLTNPVYSNTTTANPVALTLGDRRIPSTESLTVRQAAATEMFVLSGRPLPDLQVADFALDGLGTVKQPSGYDAATKILTINTQAAAANTPFTVTYAAAVAPPSGVFAEVELHYGAGAPPITAGAVQYRISFAAKQARWQYYLVTDRTQGTFSINDQNSPSIGFTVETLGSSADTLTAQMLAQQYPTLQRLRFTSDQTLPCQTSARKSFQLKLDKQVIINVLPNPSLHNFSAANNEEVLYQIVKYVTH